MENRKNVKMRGPTPNRVIVFAGAVALGGWLGWSSVGRTPRGEEMEISQRRLARETPQPRATRDELLQLARAVVEKWTQPGFDPVVEELADWTDAEIRDALNESLTDPHAALTGWAGNELGVKLLGEWVKRDFAAALAWFEALDSRAVKARLAGTLSDRWPRDKAENGLEFLRANRDLFTSASQKSLLLKAMDDRTKRGPAAVEDLLRVLREEKFDPEFGKDFHFPPGFDFQTLMRGEEVGKLSPAGVLSTILRAWCDVDREQAFDWLLENHGAAGPVTLVDNYEGSFNGRARWLGGKFQELDASQRTEFLNSMLATWFSNADNTAGFVAGISDPSVRAEVANVMPQLVFAGKASQAMPLLEAIPDPARRIQILETATPAELLVKAPDLRFFGATDEALLREKLAEWKASETQIDAIISRFKP
jgi:hypothetical protein